MEYTKGEWKERMILGERQIFADNGNNGGLGEIIACSVRHYNAPIIKAAPDMYEALKGIIDDRMTCHEMESAHIPAYIEAVYKALAKADGES